MERSKGSLAIKIAVVVASLAIISVGVVIAIQRPPSQVQETSGSYSQYSNLALQDHLINNTLYGNATLQNPSEIYTGITKALVANLSIFYYDPETKETNISLTYQVTLISTNPSWSRVTFTWERTIHSVSGNYTNMNFGINVSSNLTIGKSIDKELGYSSSDAFSLQFQAYADTAIGRSASNMTLTLGSTAYSLNGPSYSVINGVTKKNVSVPGNAIIPLPNFVGYVLIVLGAVILTYFYFNTMYVPESYTKKFLRENSKDIVELKSGPPDDAIQVANTEDIMKIAMLRESPVFAFEDKIFTESYGKTYYAEIRKNKQ